MSKSRPLLFLILATVFNIVGLGIVVPGLPFHVTSLGGDSGAAPLIFSSFSAAAMIGAPLWGWASDRLGRRSVLMVSALLTLTSYLWQAHVESLEALYACRILAGLSAGWFAISAAYVADVTCEAERAKGMGFLGASFGIGFTVGPGFGAWLVGGEVANYALPAYAAAAFTALSFIIVLLAVAEPTPTRRERTARFAARVLKNRNISLLIFLHFTVHLVFTAMEGVFAIWAAAKFGLGAREVGYYLAFSGLVTVIVQGGIVRRVVPIFGEGRLLFVGAAILCLTMLVIVQVTVPVMILLPMALLAIAIGLHNPVTQSLLSQLAPQDIKGATLGTLQSAQSLARVIGPAWGAAAFSFIGVDSPFLIGFVILMGATLYAWLVSRRFVKSVHTAQISQIRSSPDKS